MVTAIRSQSQVGRKFPKALELDWEPIRIDYISGKFSFAQLAAKHGVNISSLKMRAKRANWAADPNQMVKAVTSAVNHAVTVTVNDLLRSQQDMWKDRELRAAGKIVSVVEDRDMSDVSARDLSSLSGALDSASRVGRRALDMDTEGQVAAFASGLCSGMQIQRGPAPAVEQPAQAEVIDVSTNPPDSQPS